MEFRHLDYKLSPYTGLTRDSWIDVGKYLLRGIFQDVKNIQDPIVVKRFETEITYPHKNTSEKNREIQEKAERFEGLARSFFVAAPLIHDNPQIEIGGIKLREYYKTHILRACDKNDCLFTGDFEYLKKSGNYRKFPKFQQTVECGALAIGLWISRNEIWDMYTKDECDIIANYLFSFAYGNTHNHNWNMFNALCLAFLSAVGYTIDESRMLHHMYSAINWYSGDGWYRDGHGFDYYSSWAFNLYGPIWNVMYGYENAPELAKKIEENSNELMRTYCDFFDKDGFTNMWGRSSIYRNASTSAFVGNAFLKNSLMDYGLARRIMSGSLKQFLCRDDFLKNGVPSLGFYGQFKYLLQAYSCAASPLWCAKPFLALYFPKEHPLWTAVENNGIWEELADGEVKETILGGPALCYTNHSSNGETILRTAKVSTDIQDTEGMRDNYFKLSFNSKYPWEATPENREDIQSQQYILKDTQEDRFIRGNQMWWASSKCGVLYRKQMFDYVLGDRMERIQQMYLADFPVEYGIMRVDKLNLCDWPTEITLSGYGFPDNGTEIIKKSCGGAKAIILKGRDYTGCEKQLAMTIYDGWDSVDYINSTGTNVDSEKSVIVYAKTNREKAYDGKAKKILISQIITKESLVDFTEEEIFPIASIDYSDKYKTGAFGDIKITMKNKNVHTINFEGMDGRLSI